MSKAAQPAIERLSEHLRKVPNLKEVKSLHASFRWIGAVGGLDGLDWFLMEREALGLNDLELTDAQFNWMAKLRALVNRAIYERQLERKQQKKPSLTHEERYARILRRRDEDDRRRLAIYAHVPRQLSTAERMSKAGEALNKAA